MEIQKEENLPSVGEIMKEGNIETEEKKQGVPGRRSDMSRDMEVET